MAAAPVTPSVVMFTTNHPFVHTGGEVMFVGPELPHLVRSIGPLLLVPLHDSGEVVPLPTGVSVDRSLAASWRRGRLWYYLRAPAWPGFGREFVRALRGGGWVGAARTWRWAAVATASWHWECHRLDSRKRPSLLYSYWRGGQTLAALRWAVARPDVRVVTRVHGYDLYEERFAPPFQPWTSVYAAIDAVLAVSAHGAAHLRRTGVDARRVVLARLGVAASAPSPRSVEPRHRRVVSCSAVSALKRVDRIAGALVELARRYPDWSFEWQHFGAGEGLGALAIALRGAPANLRVNLRGAVSHAGVLAHYAAEPCDLFVLLSSTEGLPVSVQEALAAGIPVIATDVGGVGEAVDASVGILLAPHAGDGEVVAALERLLLEDDDAAVHARRARARQRWAHDFDAERNHAATTSRLAALCAIPARTTAAKG